ncbi:MAG: hypothetical protein H8E82_00885, partial [Candidatus Marinimicrobia bacterium]|nr:hypothetical protein [Candidatus Neomarinimicrobiota bacterium]
YDLTEIVDIVTTDSVAFVACSENLDFKIMAFFWSEKDGKYFYKERYNPSEERLDYISDIAVKGDSLLVASDLGLFVGNYKGYILNYPQNWERITELDGQSITPVTRLKTIGSDYYLIGNGSIWRYGDSTEVVSSAYSGTTYLKDITITLDGTLFGITGHKLVRFAEDGRIDTLWSVKPKAQRIMTVKNNQLLLSTTRGLGIFDIDEELFTWFVPNSPISNVFTALTVLEDGRLAAAGKEGISILSEYGWYNIVPSNDTTIIKNYQSDDYSHFIADTIQFKSNRVWSVVERNDEIYISIEGVVADTNDYGNPIGGGIISFNVDNPTDFSVYDTTYLNSFNEIGYQNIRGLILDDENLWISNFGAANTDKKIQIMTSNRCWFYVPRMGEMAKLDNPTEILIIKSGVAIIGSSIDDGLFVIKYNSDNLKNGSPDHPNELAGEWHGFSTSEGLENNTVWSLESTGPYIVWALTANGLQLLNFNSNYSSMTPYSITYFPSVPFGQGSKIVADYRKNLWISSISDGLYVLLQNSTPWPDWEGFRHSNSYLLSDAVTAVAIDDDIGIAYIATTKGINSLKIPFATPKGKYQNVITFPSPFRIPGDQPLVVDGLVDHSSIKIMTLSGYVLREIPSTSPSISGYQAFWDGRTNSGEYVGTGVYLLGIYSESGENYVTKIAVIHE